MVYNAFQTFGKCDKYGTTTIFKVHKCCTLWIKSCQKYRTVAIICSSNLYFTFLLNLFIYLFILHRYVYKQGALVKKMLSHRDFTNEIIIIIMYSMCVKYSARGQVRPSTCTTRLVHISVYSQKGVRLYVKSLPHWASAPMGIPFIAHTQT